MNNKTEIGESPTYESHQNLVLPHFTKLLILTKICSLKGSCCGSVGRAVASESKDPRFKIKLC